MSARVVRRGGVLVSMAACAAGAHAGAVARQGDPPGAALAPLGGGPASPARVTLEGFVLAPDGSPAEGVVVVSSAGGKALTDVAGSYRLDVEVPPEATGVEVTATGGAGGSMVASARVAVSTRLTRVDPLAFVARSPRGSACSPRWIPTFGELPGTDADVDALAVYDDGRGPALYVGGDFSSAGGVPASGIARWDGTSWSALGSGVSGIDGASVRALATYDDGSGPALYAGGYFATAGGAAANDIAKWDGSSWSPLGSGLSGGVYALVVYDDGGGPELYAGGNFQTAGGIPANDIAKWDGSTWRALSLEVGGPVRALAVYDDGGGPALYAGGQFWSAGSVQSPVIAKWDGSSWSALGSGLTVGDEDEDTVKALAVHDDGGGPALYAGGDFSSAHDSGDSYLARWGTIDADPPVLSCPSSVLVPDSPAVLRARS